MLAQDAVLKAETILALHAKLTAPAGEVGIHGDPVAHLDRLHGRSDLGNIAGDIAPRPEGKGRLESGNALAHEEVEMVEGAGAHPDENLFGPDDRIGDVLQP